MKIPAAIKAIFTSAATGIFIGSVTFAVDVGEQKKSPGESSISYEFDPQYTHVKAFEVGETYQGIPAPLGKHPLFGYLAPWSGYLPDCTLEDQSKCKFLPPQTANIKPDAIYDGIEVGSNQWVQMACEEALISAQHKGGPFGAVIVQIDDETGEVIRYWRNHNHVTEWNDPTAHAEVSTIRVVCKELEVFDLGTIKKGKSKLPQKGLTSHCEIYVNAEPCPMCYAAICWARIPVVVFAATRYDAAVQGVDFGDAAIYVEFQSLYKNRERKVRQSTCPNSLDAFNYWKRSKKIDY